MGNVFKEMDEMEAHLRKQLTEVKGEVEKVLDEIAIANTMTMQERERAEKAEVLVEELSKYGVSKKNFDAATHKLQEENKRLKETMSHVVDSMKLTPHMDSNEFDTLRWLMEQALKEKLDKK